MEVRLWSYHATRWRLLAPTPFLTHFVDLEDRKKKSFLQFCKLKGRCCPTASVHAYIISYRDVTLLLTPCQWAGHSSDGRSRNAGWVTWLHAWHPGVSFDSELLSVWKVETDCPLVLVLPFCPTFKMNKNLIAWQVFLSDWKISKSPWRT